MGKNTQSKTDLGLTPQFIDSAELAKRYGIHPITVARWRVEGQGPTYTKVGHRVLYAISDVLKWEADRKQRSTQGTT